MYVCMFYVCVCVSAASSPVTGPIDDLIIGLLEEFRASLTEPQPIEDIAIDLNEPGLIT